MNPTKDSEKVEQLKDSASSNISLMWVIVYS